jgi:hypothetical protein
VRRDAIAGLDRSAIKFKRAQLIRHVVSHVLPPHQNAARRALVATRREASRDVAPLAKKKWEDATPFPQAHAMDVLNHALTRHGPMIVELHVWEYAYLP